MKLLTRLLNRFSRPAPGLEDHPWFDQCVHGVQVFDECPPCPGGNPQVDLHRERQAPDLPGGPL